MADVAGRRIKVALDWSWDVLFPRDLSFLNTDTTGQVTHAYYRPGDFIHRQGEVARTFSMIEDGQVEVLQKDSQTSDTKVVAVLGKGDFFGEGALLGNRPHEASIRARSAVRLRQIGSALFSEIAGSFAPLRELLVKAVTRGSDFWRRLPISKSMLEGESTASFLDPLPAQLLTKDSTFVDAVNALNESATGNLLVLDERQRLWGTLDRSDLFQIIARVSVTLVDKREDASHLKLRDLLSPNLVYVALEDSAFVASSTMLDHGISWLPVVKSKDDPQPVGFLRGEKISKHMIERIAQRQSTPARLAS